MPRKSYGGKRRPRARAGSPNGSPNGSAAQPDRYQKFLPAWMKGPNGATAAAPRPVRRRRPRTQTPRHPGGYTPGKFAVDR
jgi:hypothetical protein